MVAVINYSFRRLTLTTGLSKGFADTDHPDGDWHFVKGDWGTGIIIGTAIPGLLSSQRMSVSFSAGYEYNLTEREPDLSFDVGVGYAF